MEKRIEPPRIKHNPPCNRGLGGEDTKLDKYKTIEAIIIGAILGTLAGMLNATI